MEELDLKELLQLFWEKKMQIFLIMAIFAVIGVIYSFGFVTPKYEASTSLLLATDSSSNNIVTETITATDVTINSKLVSTYSKLVESSKIVRKVISNLSLDIEEESLKKNISVTAVEDAEMIQIAVKNEDPVIATKIANETAKVFIECVKEYYGMENVHIVDEAEIPQQPSNINHIKDIIIFLFIGAVIAGIYVLISNMIDTTIKSEEDIEKIVGLTVLATIPLYEGTENRRKKGGRK